MLKKVFILSLLAAASAAVYGQSLPTPAPRPDGNRGVFVFPQNDGGYLGVQAVGVTNENMSQFGLKEARGVGVEKVVENSPAEKAGLQKSDVIVRFDGEEVKSTAKFTRLISEVAPDQKAKLTIVRGGEEREITVTMGKRQPFVFERGQAFPAQGFPSMPSMPNMQNIPSMPEMPKMQEFKLTDDMFKGNNFVWNFNGGRKIGVVSEPLTKQLGDHFGIADGKGLLVMEVREGSPAGKAGIKAGDIIVEAGGRPVAEAMDLVREINAKKEGDIEVTFIRDKNRQTVKMTPEESKEDTFFQTQPGNFRVLTTPRIPSSITTQPVSPSPVNMIAPAISSVISRLRCIL
jgi:serine protease Do